MKNERGDIKVKHIIRDIKDGALVPDEIQRLVFASTTWCSKVIESILLGQLPGILIMYRCPGGSITTILDGLQRMMTFYHFVRGKDEDNKIFKLKGLEKLKKLNGLTFNELSDDHQNKILEAQLVVSTYNVKLTFEERLKIFMDSNVPSNVHRAERLLGLHFGSTMLMFDNLLKDKEFRKLFKKQTNFYKRWEIVWVFAALIVCETGHPVYDGISTIKSIKAIDLLMRKIKDATDEETRKWEKLIRGGFTKVAKVFEKEDVLLPNFEFTEDGSVKKNRKRSFEHLFVFIKFLEQFSLEEITHNRDAFHELFFSMVLMINYDVEEGNIIKLKKYNFSYLTLLADQMAADARYLKSTDNMPFSLEDKYRVFNAYKTTKKYRSIYDFIPLDLKYVEKTPDNFLDVISTKDAFIRRSKNFAFRKNKMR